jgi:hypothetical protein
MKTCTALVTGLFALTSFPLLAQQSPPANQPGSPSTQQTPSNAEPAPPNSASASPQAPAVPMSPVNGELVSKLDSKTAKTGDSVVVQTKTPVKTPDGIEIPKGSKLVGHVIAVQPSQPGQNSQMALAFDSVELKGGKTMPIHSQIQSISPAGGASSSNGPSAPAGGAANGPQAGGSTNPGTSGAANGTSSATQAPGGSPGGASAANGAPPPGTVVAKTGQISISTTSIPGVLVANNEPGQQDPRMASTSSILLGARRDIELDGGTLIVVGVAPTGAGAAQ